MFRSREGEEWEKKNKTLKSDGKWGKDSPGSSRKKTSQCFVLSPSIKHSKETERDKIRSGVQNTHPLPAYWLDTHMQTNSEAARSTISHT